jgi:carbamoyl-phosphate synthase small subunit
MEEETKAWLALEDGTIVQGLSVGATGTTEGELCFNTGMTGYQEVFTDPSYYRQILISTNVHIGNYGIHDHEKESEKMKISGFVCREFNVKQYRKTARKDIKSYFEEEGMVAIAGVDTRALVRHIRQKGAMNALITTEVISDAQLRKRVKEIPSMAGLELASKVCTQEAYIYGAEDAPRRIAVLDLGVKRNILKSLTKRNCIMKVFPAHTSYEEMKAWNPDAYFLSNGPGDPAAMDYAVETAKAILKSRKAVFGICLGHQIIARAIGINTYKMHHGHRGVNHPVKNLISGKCEITSQNHGFAIDPDDVKKFEDIVEVTHVNLNDGTIEGIRMLDKPVFSVQYHPEASPGPWDARYLFDQFIENIN